MFLRLFNTSLRLASLSLKLLLTLYMGKYLGLSELGTYGLVAAWVAILISFLGIRFDYIVNREIVDIPALDLVCKIRDQIVFFGINYLCLIVVVVVVVASPVPGIDLKIVGYTLVLSILESLASIVSGNMISLKRPILSNILFTIRSALWVIPVLILGYLVPAYRNADFVFMFWIGGNVLSLATGFVFWRDLPWQATLHQPVQWDWIIAGLRKTIPIWIGTVSAAGAANIDRFVVEHYLGRDYVGINSFYSSFVVAISTMLSSGIYTFAYPRLIAAHRNNERQEFYNLVKMMTIQSSASSGVLAVAIGIIIPIVSAYIGRPEFVDNAPTLWLLLTGSWIKSSSESLYYALYARHQDRAVWIGNFLLFVPALLLNLLLVPLCGLIGIGYSAVISAILISLWRVYCVKKYVPVSAVPA